MQNEYLSLAARTALVVSTLGLMSACQSSTSPRPAATADTQSADTQLASSQVAKAPVESVTDLGDCPRVGGNEETVKLPEGKCHGDLVVLGNGHRISGAGKGRTIIAGRLILGGNENAISGMSIEAPSLIAGVENDAEGVEFRSGVDAIGPDNKT